MEINLPLDKAIGTVAAFILVPACLIVFKQNIKNLAATVAANVWKNKDLVIKTYLLAIAPHALILALKGFNAYIITDPIDSPGPFLYLILALVSGLFVVAVSFLAIVDPQVYE